MVLNVNYYISSWTHLNFLVIIKFVKTPLDSDNVLNLSFLIIINDVQYYVKNKCSTKKTATVSRCNIRNYILLKLSRCTPL